MNGKQLMTWTFHSIGDLIGSNTLKHSTKNISALLKNRARLFWPLKKHETYSPKEGYIRLMEPYKPQTINLI